jgi:hypothetical protein
MYTCFTEKNLYIPDVNHGVCSPSYVLILNPFSKHSFFKIHLFCCKKVDPILKHVRDCKHHILHLRCKEFSLSLMLEAKTSKMSIQPEDNLSKMIPLSLDEPSKVAHVENQSTKKSP